MMNDFLVWIGLRAKQHYTMMQIVNNVRNGVWTLAQASRITGMTTSIIEAQVLTEGFLAAQGAAGAGAAVGAGATATGTAAAGTVAVSAATGAAILGGLILGTVILSQQLGSSFGDKSITAAPRDPSKVAFTPIAFTPKDEAYTQRYFIYAVNTSGWSLYIARPAEVEGRPSHSFTDGGTSDKPVECKKLVDQPFYTEADALAYLKPLVTSSFDSHWTGHHIKFQGQDYRDVHVGKID